MKNNIVFIISVKVILIEIIFFFLLSCDMDCDNIKTLSFGVGKQHYEAGETFNTTGDRVVLFYTDGSSKTITSGFTLEWANGGTPISQREYFRWSADESAWSPIKHGDPLPVSPGSYFSLRADYMGIKSSVTTIWCRN